MESGPPNLNRIAAVLLDVDGTLIDSNAAHAESWATALTEHGYAVDAAFVRPLVGMGGDKLLPTIAGIEEDSEQGRAIGRRKKEVFAACVPALRPMPGARALLQHLQARQKDVIVATSADDKEMEVLLEQDWKDVDLHGAVAICDDPQALLDYWLGLERIEG